MTQQNVYTDSKESNILEDMMFILSDAKKK